MMWCRRCGAGQVHPTDLLHTEHLQPGHGAQLATALGEALGSAQSHVSGELIPRSGIVLLMGSSVGGFSSQVLAASGNGEVFLQHN